MNEASQYRPNPKVVFTSLDEKEGVLLHLDSKLYYGLNESGSFMWRLLENHAQCDAAFLVNGLLEKFEVKLEEAKQDVQEFVQTLKNENLIELID